MVFWCFKSGCRRLRCSDLDLTHDQPAAFVNSQIYGPWFGVAWNLAWSIYATCTLFLDIFFYTGTYKRSDWFVHYTNWCYMVTTVAMVTETIIRVFMNVKMKIVLKGDDAAMVWPLKLLWVVFNVNNVTSMVNMTFYLIFIEFDSSHSQINKVLLPSVYVITNLSFVCMTPVKILHFYQPTVFIAVYSIFSALFQYLHSDNYTDQEFILDWAQTTKSGIVLICMVLIVPFIFQGLLFFIYKLRIFICKKCLKHEKAADETLELEKQADDDTLELEKQADDETLEHEKQADDDTLPVPLQRRATATDVILEDATDDEFVDVNIDVRDDINVKTQECSNGDVCKPYDVRLFKSETDLRDYRTKNGFYCDFAKSSQILHHTFGVFCSTNGEENHVTSNFKGSQIIVVKTCSAQDDDSDNNKVTLTDSETIDESNCQNVEDDLL